MKRIFDIFASVFGLVLTGPILLVFMFLVWRQDGFSPFYIAPRVGKAEKPFPMIKLRSMIKNADKSGVDSTASGDVRITRIGHLIRKFKLDELTQLLNVLKGDMSLVGPRPNVARETNLYTNAEKQLLKLRPGITDFSSIVFADEGEILADKNDPDLAYNQIIRPGKSRLGLFYVTNRSFIMDIQLILLTILAIISRQRALRASASLLKRYGADDALVELALRTTPLQPTPPPGAKHIVRNREGQTN